MKFLEELIDKPMKKSCRPSSSGFCTFLICLLLIGLMTMSMPHAILRLMSTRSDDTATSTWLLRSPEGLITVPVNKEILWTLYPDASSFDATRSQFILPPGSDKSGTVYSRKKPEGSNKVYSVSYYDPENELQFLRRTDFRECEYDKCQMTQNTDIADSIIFYAAKLKNSPISIIRKKASQIWIFKTDEAPSRFSWFESLNRPGFRDQINWTMTHKLDSDIPLLYGRLMENDRLTNKNYDQIYKRKTKTAAWFVSHCTVRSERLLYVARMKWRIDVDTYGICGTLTCGQGEKIPGVVGMRIEADKETCFPLLSSTYKFYLAFENSLCQEYVTEKYFKLFNDVDVVPVVRGGANYKSYFPPGTFIDAADFSSPEALADFLDDLANDKDRYISYLKNKNRYRVVWDFPEWQCKLCEKLHLDRRPRVYKNIHEWFTKDSCIDPKDFL